LLTFTHLAQNYFSFVFQAMFLALVTKLVFYLGYYLHDLMI